MTNDDQKYRGKVVYFKDEGDRAFGFISPFGSDGTKESNVFFGYQSLDGEIVRVGDIVEFTLTARPAGPRPHAYKVWIVEAR
jgi:cold shock CspA family protein